MRDWKETEHPRDEDGKFTAKGGSKTYRQDTPYHVILQNDKRMQEEKVKQNRANGNDGSNRYKEASLPFETDSKTFHNTIIEAKASILENDRWRVDIHDIEDYKNDKLFITKGGSCVAVEPDGNIISVCRMAGEVVRGSDLIKHAIANGGDRLDAFSGLYTFYIKNGFEPVSWTPFDTNYAPEGWKSEYGKEPVIFYKYTGKISTLNYEQFINTVKPSIDYDRARLIRDRSIENEEKI